MRGRRATFPEAQTAPPRPFSALRFEVPVEDGGHVTVALPDYSRPRLVRAFGAALRDSLTAPGVVCTPTKVRTHADQLRRLLMFIDTTGEAVDTVEAIDPGLLDRYEVWLKRHTHAGAISRRHLLARPILLLRRMEEEAPGTLAMHLAGDESLGMYGIVEGSLKVYLSADSHGPFFVHVLTAGIWGGEGPAIIRGPRPVTLVAASETKILFLTRAAMTELAAEHPEFWEFYSFHLMSHLTTALSAISDLMIRDHETRLISVLLRLGNYRSPSEPRESAEPTGPITIHLSQDELALAANVGRTTVNRQLLKLKKANLVDIAYGRIVLLDPAGLKSRLTQSA